MVIPRAIPADPVRTVIGPDHPAVAVRIAVIGGIVGRSVEAPEVMPVIEMRPIVRVAIAAVVERAIAAIATTAEHGRGAETAAVKTTAVEAATSAVETAAAMTATTMTATAAVPASTAVPTANLDHRSVGRDFR